MYRGENLIAIRMNTQVQNVTRNRLRFTQSRCSRYGPAGTDTPPAGLPSVGYRREAGAELADRAASGGTKTPARTGQGLMRQARHSGRTQDIVQALSIEHTVYPQVDLVSGG